MSGYDGARVGRARISIGMARHDLQRAARDLNREMRARVPDAKRVGLLKAKIERLRADLGTRFDVLAEAKGDE